MITDLTIKYLEPSAYTMIVQGNDGEDEATISTSPGQDGRCRCVFVAASVDGGMELRFKGDFPTPQLRLRLRSMLLAWAVSGLPPTEHIYPKLRDACERISHQACHVWGALE